MDLQEEYKEETGFSVGTIKDTGTTYYSDDYTKWLEAKINYTRCCESDSEQLLKATLCEHPFDRISGYKVDMPYCNKCRTSL